MSGYFNKILAAIKRLVPLFCLLLLFLAIFLTARDYLNKLPEVKEANGRINFAVLGISGGDYKPPDLTDTMILASYQKKLGRTIVFSLPRDLWVSSIQAKINAAYHYGGFELTRKTLEEVTGQPIHYFFVIDFDGFKKAVDFLGGIEVEVQTAFDDFKYPIAGKENDECGGDKQFLCRYEHVHFDQGWQIMDGDEALKFVRSRNAAGDEGTDFAREKRQQNFLAGFKKAVLSRKVLLSPRKILGLVKIFSDSVKTNVKEEEYYHLFLSFLKFKQNEIQMVNLSGVEEESLFYNPKKHSSGQWVLLPVGGNWEKVKEFVLKQLE